MDFDFIFSIKKEIVRNLDADCPDNFALLPYPGVLPRPHMSFPNMLGSKIFFKGL